MNFIIVVKPDGNKFLFDWVEGFDWSQDLSKRIEYVTSCPQKLRGMKYEQDVLKFRTPDPEAWPRGQEF